MYFIDFNHILIYSVKSLKKKHDNNDNNKLFHVDLRIGMYHKCVIFYDLIFSTISERNFQHEYVCICVCVIIVGVNERHVKQLFEI